jgi:hypothetical protein
VDFFDRLVIFDGRLDELMRFFDDFLGAIDEDLGESSGNCCELDEEASDAVDGCDKLDLPVEMLDDGELVMVNYEFKVF